MKRKQIVNDDEGLNLTHHQRKLKYLKTRRTLRKFEILMARTRVTMRVVTVVFVFWLLIQLVNLPQWYLSPYIFTTFPNNHLEIEGNQITSNKQILGQLSKMQLPSKPIYLLDIKPLEKAILQLDPVKKVYIRRFWLPARLKVVIDEKNPVLSISPSPQIKPVAAFTEDGTILNDKFLPLPVDKKVFLILTYNDISKWSTKHVNHLVYLSKLIEGYTRRKLLYIDIRNPDDVFAQLDNVKLRLGAFDRTVFIRTKRIADIIDETLKIKDEIDYIDLRWEKTISIKLKNKQEARIDKDTKLIPGTLGVDKAKETTKPETSAKPEPKKKETKLQSAE